MYPFNPLTQSTGLIKPKQSGRIANHVMQSGKYQSNHEYNDESNERFIASMKDNDTNQNFG